MDIISPKLLDITYKNFTQEEKELLCKLLERVKENFWRLIDMKNMI